MSEDFNSPDAHFKILIIGDSGVGKSCFLLQFTQGKFRSDFNVTLGVEYTSKLLTVNNKLVKLQIWDTAGQENFRAITRSFYRNANAIILVYDLTRRESFDNLDGWMGEIKANSSSEILVFLVGNMLDRVQEREIPTTEAESFVETNKLGGLWQVSAKTAENVTEVFFNQVFMGVADTLYQKSDQSIPAPKQILNPVLTRPKPKRKCC